jgi:hypothetical protein
MATQILSDAELEKLRRFPELSREELVRYFTLTPADESFLIGHRRQGNRLGVAVQLCTLPWLGFVPRRCRVCTGTSGRAAGRPLGCPSRGSLVLRGARPHPDRPPGRGDQVPALAPGWRRRTQGTEPSLGGPGDGSTTHRACRSAWPASTCELREWSAPAPIGCRAGSPRHVNGPGPRPTNAWRRCWPPGPL